MLLSSLLTLDNKFPLYYFPISHSHNIQILILAFQEVSGSDEPTASSKVEVHPEAPPTSEAPPTMTSSSGEERGREDPRTAVFLQTASFLLDVHALKVLQRYKKILLASTKI